MKNTLKLIVSELLHKVNYLNAGSTAAEKEILRNLKEKGFHVIENFLTKEECALLVNKADDYFQSGSEHVSIESAGADQRVYGIDRLSQHFNIEKLKTFSETIFSKFAFTPAKDYFLLLGKISATENNLGSGSGWHRDSPFMHQFKSILYLTDVSAETGPFEYLHSSANYGVVKAISQLIKKPLSEYRYTDTEIKAAQQALPNLQSTKFTGKAGTLILVNTKGLHRGTPLKSGNRYALTSYHFQKKMDEQKFFKMG